MRALESLSLLVGTAQCNAHCDHCAGIPIRRDAPKEDEIDDAKIYATLRECYAKGARALSLSSSGEPTLSPNSVTRTLELVERCAGEGMIYRPVNIYSNGIRIGEDEGFANKNLPFWRKLGLTNVYITVHDLDERENARVYRIERYPPLKLILERIHRAGLRMRANLILNKETIGTFEKYALTVQGLENLGVDAISAWPIRDLRNNVDWTKAPEIEELTKMREWAAGRANAKVVGLDRIREERKLLLSQDGRLSGEWCNS